MWLDFLPLAAREMAFLMGSLWTKTQTRSLMCGRQRGIVSAMRGSFMTHGGCLSMSRTYFLAKHCNGTGGHDFQGGQPAVGRVPVR